MNIALHLRSSFFRIFTIRPFDFFQTKMDKLRKEEQANMRLTEQIVERCRRTVCCPLSVWYDNMAIDSLKLEKSEKLFDYLMAKNWHFPSNFYGHSAFIHLDLQYITACAVFVQIEGHRKYANDVKSFLEFVRREHRIIANAGDGKTNYLPSFMRNRDIELIEAERNALERNLPVASETTKPKFKL